MELLAYLAVVLVALLHLVFLILEMFLWTKPLGRKVFHLSQEKATETAVLAANQGLYNGFLSAGLVWGILSENYMKETLVFFLSCIIVAGVFAALTVNRNIFWIQAFPALFALGLVLFVI